MADKRIITLLAAATEVVCALGLEQNLVGISHECDHPEWVKNLPVCSRANLLPGLSSKAIDGQVRDMLADALSIYTIDTDTIRRLRPDVIITQTQCEVCAVSLKDVEQALENLLGSEVQVISLAPNTLADIFDDMARVADALGVDERGEQLLESLNERVDIIRHKLKYIADKPTVACIEWIEPLMIAGNWTPDMVEIAGGRPVLAAGGNHSPYVSAGRLMAQDPDIIIVMPCGFGIERTLKEMQILLSLPGFSGLKAVKTNRMYIADGNRYFNRSGPGIVGSMEILAEIINPKQFIFGYEGTGWIKFSI